MAITEGKKMIKNIILRVKGARWMVIEATSIEAALNEIAWARVSGSVGGKSLHTFDGVTTLVSHVHRLNDDNTLRMPS